MNKFDIYITYVCDSSCMFCCVLDKIEWFKDTNESPHMAFKDVVALIDEKRCAGYNYVTLTGGEPTLHPKFSEIIRYCKKNNMRVSLNTNAVMLADKTFCRENLPYIDEMVVSIHGHTPELHNKFTGKKKSFEGFVSAMDNIHSSGCDVYLITDTVLITENIAFMDEMSDFLLGFPKLEHILFSNVNIPPDRVDGLKHLVPTLAQIGEILPGIVRRIAREADRTLRFYGIPFCILKDYHAYSSDLFYEPKMVLDQIKQDGGMIKRESPAPRPDKAKLKTEKCKGCLYFNTCGGFFNSYYSIYKDEHISPIHR